MRQPVASVFALAAAALAEPAVSVSVRTRLEQIVEQTQWLADMIQQWLRAEDLPEAVTGPINLARLAGQAADAERVTYRGGLDVVGPAEPVLAGGNPVDIRRIISNLLGNATRAAGPQGTVRIEVSRDQDLAFLVVEDSGPGFGCIQEGSGLGLRAVARSIDKCAGSIEYGRASLGGVRVRLSLPLLAGRMQRNRADATGSL